MVVLCLNCGMHASLINYQKSSIGHPSLELKHEIEIKPGQADRSTCYACVALQGTGMTSSSVAYHFYSHLPVYSIQILIWPFLFLNYVYLLLQVLDEYSVKLI